MRNIRYIKSADLLVGAVYLNNVFKIYVIDPSQLQFEIIAEAAVVESPVKVDENIASDNFKGSEALPLAKTLADAKSRLRHLRKNTELQYLCPLSAGMQLHCARTAPFICQIHWTVRMKSRGYGPHLMRSTELFLCIRTDFSNSSEIKWVNAAYAFCLSAK